MTKAVQISLYIFAFFAVWTCRVVTFDIFNLRLEGTLQGSILANALRFLIWVLPVFVFLFYVSKVNAFEYLRLKPLAMNAVIWTAVVFAIAFLYQISLFHLGLDKFDNHKGLASYLTPVVFAPMFEEILFRGFIQQKLNELISFTGAVIITSVLFVAIHFPGWWFIGGYTLVQMARMSVGVFVISTMTGWLLYKSRSLYPGIVLHSANNVISAI